jgi:hypothetical protein
LARFFSDCVQAKYRLVAPLTREGLGLARMLSCLGCAFHLPSPLPRVNTARRRRSFLYRSSVLHPVRHSAKLLGLLARGVALGLNMAVRPSAASARFGATARWPSHWHPAAVAKRHRCLAFAAKLVTVGKAHIAWATSVKQRGSAAMAARSESSAYLACFMRVQNHPGLTGGSTRTPTLARASVGALRASRYGAG